MNNYSDFDEIDARAGTIVEVHDFPEARKPVYKVIIDFGPEIGTKWSCTGITKRYSKEDLIGKRVLGMLNVPEEIKPLLAPILGLPDVDENFVPVLKSVSTLKVPNGDRLF